ncbi:MAG TPA: glycosyltransferase [Steroidobacteraceae bacterium]|nr:glycosyltransferase [Steroidobacteraceae bacterium]
MSIVVVIYNAAEPLEVLLTGLVPHLGSELEIVVIDGGSKDRTLACIERHERHIDYWRSERDQGIYDAMNKGIACATGSYILHLNAGDRLLEVPYAELEDCLANAVDVACFAVLLSSGITFRPRDGLRLRLDNTWHHQGTFYLRRSHPGYDLRFPVYADFDANQKLQLRRARVRSFSKVVAEFSLDGASTVMGSHRERYRVIRKNFGALWVCLAFVRFTLNVLRAQLRGWRKKRAPAIL